MEPRTERGKRLMEIAENLRILYTNIATYTLTTSRGVSDLKKLEIKLTPEGGWYGKNDMERKASRDYALAGSPEYSGLNQVIAEDNAVLVELSNKITVFETERRALEWCIRDEMVASRYSFFEDDAFPAYEQASQ